MQAFRNQKIIILLFVSLVVLAITFIPGYLRIKRLSRKNRELQRQIEEIKQVNSKLQEEQRRMSEDPLYLENVVREKLGVARKGEVIYKVLAPQEN